MYGLKKYIVAIIILMAIIFFSIYFGIKDVEEIVYGGSPKIESNYNIAFDKIECCMTYNRLSSILGEGKAISWDVAFVGDSGGIPSAYRFDSEGYKIITQGMKLYEATLFKDNNILKQINNCAC